MTSSNGQRQYLLDTSMLVNIRDVYKDDEHVWSQIIYLIEAGEVKTVRQVWEELERRFKDIFARLKPYKKKILIKDDVQYAMTIVTELRAIKTNHPKLYRETGNNNSADPFLIAVGKHIGAIVVTDEAKSGPGYQSKIPHVCRQRNVGCMNSEDFLQAIGDDRIKNRASKVNS